MARPGFVAYLFVVQCTTAVLCRCFYIRFVLPLISVLHYARYYRPIGDIAAVLILGAKNLIEYRTIVQEKRYLFGLIRRKTETTIKVDKKAELAKIILENVSPTTLFNVVVQRLQDMEIGSFFAITTSLSEANILKPTKEVVKD